MMTAMESRNVTEEKTVKVQQFDVIFVELPKVEGCPHIQRGIHPAIVIGNNKQCAFAPNVFVLPLSSKVMRKFNPCHLMLNIEAAKKMGLYKPSVAKAEDMCPVDKHLIKNVVGHISDTNVIDAIKHIINEYLGNLY